MRNSLLFLLLLILSNIAHGQKHCSRVWLEFPRGHIWAGMSNFVYLSTYGVDAKELEIDFNGEYTLNDDGNLNLYVPRPGKWTLTINHKDFEKPLNYTVRAKWIPNPEVRLTNGKYDGVLRAREMRGQSGLSAPLANFGIQLWCDVHSFKLIYIPKNGEVETVENKSGKFQGRVHEIIQNVETGDALLFQEVKVNCPGYSRPREASGLSFYLE